MSMEYNETPFMNVGTLKEMLKDVPDDTEVYIACCRNHFGNIVEAGIAEKTDYGFFGESIPCIIIQPADSSYLITAPTGTKDKT